MNVISPVVGTDNIRYADFVRVTTPSATYRFASTPSAITVPSIDNQPFGALGILMKVGDTQRDIKSTANETNFTLVGIDTAMLGWVLGQQVKGSQIEAWKGFFDTNGVLISNNLTYSQDFTNAVWVKYGTTITPNTVIAPDGTMTGSTYAQTGGAGYLNQPSANTTTATSMSLSFYAKASTSTWALATMKSYADGSETAWFNLSTGTVGIVGSNLNASIVDSGNGWYRCSISKKNPTTTDFVIFAPAVTNGSVDNGSQQIYCWGAQIQQTTQPSQYVATTTTINSGLYQFFNGYINSFAIQETWMEEIRQFVGVISVSASSIQLILKNRTAGRYTNDNNWQFFSLGDTSMNRVPFITNINYNFGKGASPNS
jgi:hypothetical protein